LQNSRDERGICCLRNRTHPIDASRAGARTAAGSEGAPDAWLEVFPAFARGLIGIGPIEAIDGTPVVDIKAVLVDAEA
jgi:tRNA (Thr-GGU) A37 N-methylase